MGISVVATWGPFCGTESRAKSPVSRNLVSAALGFVYSPARRDEHVLAFRKCWLLCAEPCGPGLRESHAQINYSVTVNGFDVDGTDMEPFQ